MKNALGALTVLVVLFGCRDKPVPTQAPSEPPDKVVEKKTTKKQKTEPPKTPAIQIRTFDRTESSERPVEITDQLQALVEKAGKRAGFKLDPEGALAGVEIHYGIVVGDKLVAKAERGLLTWTVVVTLRIEDELGLAEDLIGKSYGESPFVRAAVPDLKKAFLSVLPTTAHRAFLDARMQHVYLNVDAKIAADGLKSRAPQEIWAAMRRLGELKHTASVPAIIDFASDPDVMMATIAMGVLGRIKDPRAIKPLARLATDEKLTIAISAAQALASIGTAEARAALESIATKHSSEEIRNAVKELLAP